MGVAVAGSDEGLVVGVEAVQRGFGVLVAQTRVLRCTGTGKNGKNTGNARQRVR